MKDFVIFLNKKGSKQGLNDIITFLRQNFIVDLFLKSIA
jgi:hypothetical protein